MKIDTDTVTITKKELKDAMFEVSVEMSTEFMKETGGSPMGGLAVISMVASLARRLCDKFFGAEEDEEEKPETPQVKFGDEE